MLVDNAVVGSIIGKGGQTIRKVSTESGATIQVQGRDDVSPSQLERRVTITSVSWPGWAWGEVDLDGVRLPVGVRWHRVKSVGVKTTSQQTSQ